MSEKRDVEIKNMMREAKRDFGEPLSPFVKTRIFAHLNEFSPKHGWIRHPLFAFIQGAVLASLIFTFLYKGVLERPAFERNFNGIVDQPYALNIELEKIDVNKVQWVRVDLSSDLHFYSKNYGAKVAHLKTLSVPIETVKLMKKLPFIIKADEEGAKEVKISFLDGQKRILKVKKISMIFSGSKEIVF